MIQITLPDGSQRSFPGPVTVAEVAASIGTGLAKAALGGKVNASPQYWRCLPREAQSIFGDVRIGMR